MSWIKKVVVVIVAQAILTESVDEIEEYGLQIRCLSLATG